MQKKKLLYLIVFFAVLIANVLIVLFQINKASVSLFSVLPILLMLGMTIHAIYAYLLRHKGNYLYKRVHGIINPFGPDKDYTFTDEYSDRFFFMLKIHCIVIPFYIPMIFLTEGYVQLLWIFVPAIFRESAYLAMGISETVKDIKEEKERNDQLEKERLEQERREELGKWK